MARGPFLPPNSRRGPHQGHHPSIRPPGFPHMPFPPSGPPFDFNSVPPGGPHPLGGPLGSPGPHHLGGPLGFEGYHHDFTGSGNFLPPGGPYPPPNGMPDMTSLENMANYHHDGPPGPHPGAESPNSSCSGNGGNPLHAFPSPPPQTQDFSSNDFPPSGGENSNSGHPGSGNGGNPVENNFTTNGQNPVSGNTGPTEQCYPSPPLSLEYSTSPAMGSNPAPPGKSSTTAVSVSNSSVNLPLPQAAMV